MFDLLLLSLGACISGLVRMMGNAYATEITVMSDTPVAAALGHIGDIFHQSSGNDIKFVFGLSPIIHKKVTDGEPGDVLIIQPNFIDDLASSGKITAGQHPTIAKVGAGLFMRADARAPDVSTVDASSRLCSMQMPLCSAMSRPVITLSRCWIASAFQMPS